MRDTFNPKIRLEIYEDMLDLLKNYPEDTEIRNYDSGIESGLCIVLKCIACDSDYSECYDNNGDFISFERTPDFFPEFAFYLKQSISYRMELDSENEYEIHDWRIKTMENCILDVKKKI